VSQTHSIVRLLPRTIGLLFCAAAATQLNVGATETVLRYANQNVQLSIAEVSAHTLRIVLAPADAEQASQLNRGPVLLAREWPSPALKVTSLTNQLVHEFRALRIHVDPSPLTVSVSTKDGRPVQRLGFSAASGEITLSPGDGPIFGLGEGGAGFDRRGIFDFMDNGHRAGEYQIHGSRVPIPLLIGAQGWGLFLHRPWNAGIDLRGDSGRILPRQQPRDSTEAALPLDVFVMYGKEPADVLKEYVGLTGKPAMPPKWALGYMQSHRTLSGPAEVLKIAQTFREKRLPCDALIYLGTGYTPLGWNTGHGSFEFNRKAFDDPKKIVDGLHSLNFKVVLHINAAPRNLHGEIPAGATEAPAPDQVATYWAKHKGLMALGVDGWWPDDGDELSIDARLARHRMYYVGSLQERPGLRSFSLHRTGYAGMQRYGGWVWSGDTYCLWDTLAAHIPIGLNASLSLSPFWGSDTGGFTPTRQLTGELYTRWFQFSSFTPSFRSHGRVWHTRLPWGWNTGELGPNEVVTGSLGSAAPDSSELHNAQVEPICRRYLELRYRLMPYLYSAVREAHDTGMPIMRALWLHYPKDRKAVACSNEYLWGRDILVAPIVEPGATHRTVYLPDGLWYDFWSGAPVMGNQVLTRYVDLSTMPIYVRAGAILPMDPPRQYVDEPSNQPMELRIYSGADGEALLYEDDGKSADDASCSPTWTRLRWQEKSRTLTLEPDQPGGQTAIRPKHVQVRVIPLRIRADVDYQGKRVEMTLRQGR
jgi:alpha-glucosidase/alpha-D-xyloside xylohydrolase